ncbi:MAG: hypothetical protein C0502_03705 [Opitutus sp.]|nr:hypothetical protein [Opitutus sp.]
MPARQTITLILACLSPLLAFARDDAPSVRLPEDAAPGLSAVLKTALAQSPRLVSRNLDLEAAEHARQQGRAGLRPTVSGAYRLLQARDDRADLSNAISVTRSYYDLQINQPVFHWGERRNNARLGEITKLIAEQSYREAYRQLAQEIRQRYLGLIVQRHEVERQRRLRERAARQAKLAQERVAGGAITAQQAEPALLEAEQAAIALERAEFEFESTRTTFMRLAGLDQLDVPSDIAGWPLAADEAGRRFQGMQAEAAAQGGDATSSLFRLQIEAEELNWKNQRVRVRPKFSLLAGANQDLLSYTVNVAQRYRVSSLYAGIGVHWLLFDGFESRSAARAALARRRQLEYNLARHQDEWRERLAAQVRFLGFSARDLQIAERRHALAEARLATRRTDRAAGRAADADIDEAELATLDSKIALLRSRADYLLRSADFVGATAGDPAFAGLSDKP